MKVQAVWENGVFRPTTPLTLRHRSVTIQVPDDEIVVNEAEPATQPVDRRGIPEAVWARAAAMRARREEILRRPVDEGPELPLTEDQEQRARAFELRNELRREQGRPV